MLEFDRHPGVPLHTRESLEGYARRGWRPGGFVRAVLTNDLSEAAGRADHMNRRALPEIVALVQNELPMQSWGSEKAVRDWIAAGGLEGIEAAKAAKEADDEQARGE